jgi:hypothetical protein
MGFRMEELGSSSWGGGASIGSGLSRRNLRGKVVWLGFLLEGISSLASPCGGSGRSFMERYAPAEPDDPNSSTLNPNLQGKLGVGKSIDRLDILEAPSIEYRCLKGEASGEDSAH